MLSEHTFDKKIKCKAQIATTSPYVFAYVDKLPCNSLPTS